MRSQLTMANTSFVDTPKLYIYKSTIEARTAQRIFYVVDSLMNNWGIEKGGTEIQKASSLYTNHMNYLKSLFVLDSIKTK